MMFDIDNLKYINDNYGHDFGDRYIQSAANSLVEKFKTVPKKIYGRRSGDEFYAFIYGYESLDEVKKEVKEIHDSFRTVSLAVTAGRRSACAFRAASVSILRTAPTANL